MKEKNNLNWKKIKLEEVISFTNGKAHENSIVENGRFIVVNSKFISSNGIVIKKTNEQKSPLFRNDIAMVMSDVPNGRALAKCFLVNEDQKYTLNQRICKIKTKDQIHFKYLFYILNRNKYYISFDDGINQTNLKKSEVLNCPILLPSLPEQKKIVEILSTWDQAIEIINKLTSAKEKQFKWLLKKLITDQKNNPNWKKVKLGDICIFKYGKSLKTKDRKKGKYPVFGSNGVIGYHNKYLVKKPFIIVGRKGTAGSITYSDKNGYPIDTTFYIKIINKDRVDLQFFFYILNTLDLKNINKQTGVPGLNRNDAYKLHFFLPPLFEQKRISEKLSTSEKEIETLKQLSKKYEKQKKGLMQKLLTGKIKLNKHG